MVLMIENYEEYEDFVKHVTRTAPLLKTEQLRIMISRYFGQTMESIDEVLFALQRNQAILMSSDGWTVTVGEYIKLTGDRFLRRRNNYEAYGETTDEYNRLIGMDDKCSDVNRPLSKALWLVADMMPDSIDFAICESPWVVAFATPPYTAEESPNGKEIPSLLYEITYIAKGYESTRTELLRVLPKIQSNHAKDGIRRICILDDPEYAFRVPYIGFSHIVTMDPTSPRHYRVIETRKKDIRWKDDPYHD